MLAPMPALYVQGIGVSVGVRSAVDSVVPFDADVVGGGVGVAVVAPPVAPDGAASARPTTTRHPRANDARVEGMLRRAD
jgi:hypothetical protein